MLSVACQSRLLFVSAVVACLFSGGHGALDVVSSTPPSPNYRRGPPARESETPVKFNEGDNLAPYRSQEGVFGDVFTGSVANPLELLTTSSDLLSRGASAFTEGVAALLNAGSVPLTAMGRVFMEPVASAASLIYKPFTDLMSVTAGIPQSAPPRRLFFKPSSSSSEFARNLRTSPNGRLPSFEDAIDPFALLFVPPSVPEMMLRPAVMENERAEAAERLLLGTGPTPPAIPRSLRGGGGSGGTFNYSNYPYYAGHPYWSRKTGYFETPYPEPFMSRPGETPTPFTFDFGPQGPRVRVDNGVLVPV